MGKYPVNLLLSPDEVLGYSFGIVRPYVHSVRPSIFFVCPEPYPSTYWSDLIHSWYKW